MKKFTFLLTSFLLLLLGNACKNQDKNAFIKGKLHGTKAKVVYLEKVTPQGNELVDSASIKSDGSFTMLKKPDAKGYYILRIGKVRVFNTANLPPHAILLISDPTEKIELEAHGPDFKTNYTVKGSEETALMKEVSDYIEKIALTLDSLRPEVAITNGMTIDDLQAAQKAEAQNRVAWVKKFVSDHAGKLVTIQALSLINLEENFSLAEQVVQSLKDKFPDDPYIMNLRANLAYMSPFVIGAVAPDFTISTPTGNPISLKDFRGKYVLVDFWASWCRPCRAVNPALVEIYNQFKNKNFTVFGVSLDAKKEDWLKAIKDDKLTWEHGSDLAYWNSAPAKLYRVTGIPYSVLLDPEGKIIAKNLHPDQLGSLLTQVFEKQ